MIKEHKNMRSNKALWATVAIMVAVGAIVVWSFIQHEQNHAEFVKNCMDKRQDREGEDKRAVCEKFWSEANR